MLNSLCFADGPAISSLSEEWLLNKINIPENYCQKRGFEINIKQTKVYEKI